MEVRHANYVYLFHQSKFWIFANPSLVHTVVVIVTRSVVILVACRDTNMNLRIWRLH